MPTRPDAELLVRASDALTRAVWAYRNDVALGLSGSDALATLRSNYATLGALLRDVEEVSDVEAQG